MPHISASFTSHTAHSHTATQVCVCLAVHLSVNCQFIILSLPVIKVMLKRHKALLSPWKLSFLLFKETSSNDYRVFRLLGRSHGCLLI